MMMMSSAQVPLPSFVDGVDRRDDAVRSPPSPYSPRTAEDGDGDGGDGGGGDFPRGTAKREASGNSKTAKVMSELRHRLLIDRRIMRSIDDGTFVLIAWSYRLCRVMVLWIIFHYVDRAYQDRYVRTVLATPDREQALASDQLRLWTLPLAAHAAELVVFVMFMLLLLTFVWGNKRTGSHVLDEALATSIARHWFQSTVTSTLLGSLVAREVSRNGQRMRDDGLRGVRAASLMAFTISTLAVVAVPIT